MIKQSDLQGLSKIFNPEDAVENVPEEIMLEKLDFTYISNCNNSSELGSLLAYLEKNMKSWYPQLEIAIQNKIKALNPELHFADEKDIKKEVEKELNSWFSAMDEESDGEEEQQDVENADENPAKTKVQQQSKTPSKPIKTYQEWEKFDAGLELERDSTKSSRTLINHSKEIQIPKLGRKDRIFHAENEKYKGNECLRANEIEEAHQHYTLSIKLNPTQAAYNNRTVSALKLKNYSLAIDDATMALEYGPNLKSYLRRSKAYFSIGKYQNAIQDIDMALEIEPNNKECQQLRKEALEKWMDVDGVMARDASRLTIHEIEDSHSVKIVDVDCDSDSDTE